MDLSKSLRTLFLSASLMMGGAGAAQAGGHKQDDAPHRDVPTNLSGIISEGTSEVKALNKNLNALDSAVTANRLDAVPGLIGNVEHNVDRMAALIHAEENTSDHKKHSWKDKLLHSQYSKGKAQRQLNNRLLGIENKMTQMNVNGVHDQNIHRMHSLREKVMESKQPAVQATAPAVAQKAPAPQAAPSPEAKKPRPAATPRPAFKRPSAPSSPPPVAKAPDRPKKGLSFSFGAKASGSFKIGKGNVSQNLKDLIGRIKR